jgi:pyruvate, water dikinase
MVYKKGADMEGMVKWFSELSNSDIAIAGGKGASLGEMYNSKFPVPPGFVITAQAFDYFISKNDLKQEINKIILKLDMEDTEELEKKSKEIRKMVESQEIPEELETEILEAYHILGSEKISRSGISESAFNILKNSYEPAFVAVRSSATTEDLGAASFAGAGETFVNTKGDRQLLINVKKCFSSLYTARAIYYRKKQGFGVDKVDSLLAAVVQKMVDSEKSGVVFSRNPVTSGDEIVVEAVFGLGEGIVSGQINPDNYLVSRDLKIESVKLADKKIAIVRSGSGENITVKLNPEKTKSQVLTTGEILRIADYAIKLEEHYKKPQDIEFAVEEGKVYIVQSRPITTLGEKKKSEEISGKVILSGSGASPGIGVGVVRIIKSMSDLPKIKKGDVLVTEMTNPDMVVAMERSVAIVTDEGGLTSHAAIVSREMGIPAVVGTGNATSVLFDGMKITVDGSNGKVYEGQVSENKFAEVRPIVPVKRIKIKLILDLPDFVERAAKSNIEYVGLQRIEGIIAESGEHPLLFEKENKLDEYKNILVKGISQIAKHFKSVWIRSSDIRTDEFDHLKGAPGKELNPMLGFHGIRFSLKHPKIFETEIKAISEVAEKYPEKEFGVMFPQVISIEEVRAAKEMYTKYKTSNMIFGVMIETPAAVQIIEDICEEGVKFISFGTNDLTQFTLAVDRGNEDVQYIYNEFHPAIFSQIKKVLGVCRRYNVETSICGQAGSKKEMAEFLFRQGIHSISVNADAAYDVSVLLSKLESENVGNNYERRNENSRDATEVDDDKKYNKIEEERRSKNREQREEIEDRGDKQEQVSEKRGEQRIQSFEKPVGSENWSKSKWKRWRKRHRSIGGSSEAGAVSKLRGLLFDKRGEMTLAIDDFKEVKERAGKIQEEVKRDNELELESEKEIESGIEVEKKGFFDGEGGSGDDAESEEDSRNANEAYGDIKRDVNDSGYDKNVSKEYTENQEVYGDEDVNKGDDTSEDKDESNRADSQASSDGDSLYTSDSSLDEIEQIDDSETIQKKNSRGGFEGYESFE